MKRKGKKAHRSPLHRGVWLENSFLGGVNILTSIDGLFAAKVLFEFLQGKTIKVDVEDGATLEVTLGKAPVVDGQTDGKRCALVAEARRRGFSLFTWKRQQMRS